MGKYINHAFVILLVFEPLTLEKHIVSEQSKFTLLILRFFEHGAIEYFFC